MGLFAQGPNANIDASIESAKAAVANTEKFLARLKSSDVDGREYVRRMREKLREQLTELSNRKVTVLKDTQES